MKYCPHRREETSEIVTKQARKREWTQMQNTKRHSGLSKNSGLLEHSQHEGPNEERNRKWKTASHRWKARNQKRPLTEV